MVIITIFEKITKNGKIRMTHINTGNSQLNMKERIGTAVQVFKALKGVAGSIPRLPMKK